MASITILLSAYLLPTIIAAYRSHKNMLAIIGLNVLLGWTLLGWVGAIVWSLTNQDEYRALREEKGIPIAGFGAQLKNASIAIIAVFVLVFVPILALAALI